MTTLAPIILSKTPTNLITGLTEGDSYIAQNVSGGLVEYCNYPTDPDGVDIGWRLAKSYDFFQFDAEATNPVWARASTHDSARLSIGSG